MKNRNTPDPSFLTLKFNPNIKLNKLHFSRLTRSNKGSNYGSLNMVRKGDDINWNVNNYQRQNLSSGIYIVKLYSKTYSESSKIMFIK